MELPSLDLEAIKRVLTNYGVVSSEEQIRVKTFKPMNEVLGVEPEVIVEHLRNIKEEEEKGKKKDPYPEISVSPDVCYYHFKRDIDPMVKEEEYNDDDCDCRIVDSDCDYRIVDDDVRSVRTSESVDSDEEFLKNIYGLIPNHFKEHMEQNFIEFGFDNPYRLTLNPKVQKKQRKCQVPKPFSFHKECMRSGIATLRDLINFILYKIEMARIIWDNREQMLERNTFDDDCLIDNCLDNNSKGFCKACFQDFIQALDNLGISQQGLVWLVGYKRKKEQKNMFPDCNFTNDEGNSSMIRNCSGEKEYNIKESNDIGKENLLIPDNGINKNKLDKPKRKLMPFTKPVLSTYEGNSLSVSKFNFHDYIIPDDCTIKNLSEGEQNLHAQCNIKDKSNKENNIVSEKHSVKQEMTDRESSLVQNNYPEKNVINYCKDKDGHSPKLINVKDDDFRRKDKHLVFTSKKKVVENKKTLDKNFNYYKDYYKDNSNSSSQTSLDTIEECFNMLEEFADLIYKDEKKKDEDEGQEEDENKPAETKNEPLGEEFLGQFTRLNVPLIKEILAKQEEKEKQKKQIAQAQRKASNKKQTKINVKKVVSKKQVKPNNKISRDIYTKCAKNKVTTKKQTQIQTAEDLYIYLGDDIKDEKRTEENNPCSSAIYTQEDNKNEIDFLLFLLDYYYDKSKFLERNQPMTKIEKAPIEQLSNTNLFEFLSYIRHTLTKHCNSKESSECDQKKNWRKFIAQKQKRISPELITFVQQHVLKKEYKKRARSLLENTKNELPHVETDSVGNRDNSLFQYKDNLNDRPKNDTHMENTKCIHKNKEEDDSSERSFNYNYDDEFSYLKEYAENSIQSDNTSLDLTGSKTNKCNGKYINSTEGNSLQEFIYDHEITPPYGHFQNEKFNFTDKEGTNKEGLGRSNKLNLKSCSWVLKRSNTI